MTAISQKNKTDQMKSPFEGEVVSTGAQKTIGVMIKTQKLHKKYKKHYTTSRKFAVHDERGEAKKGDWVVFEECRPISKTKRWRLIRIIKSQ